MSKAFHKRPLKAESPTPPPPGLKPASESVQIDKKSALPPLQRFILESERQRIEQQMVERIVDEIAEATNPGAHLYPETLRMLRHLSEGEPITENAAAEVCEAVAEAGVRQEGYCLSEDARQRLIRVVARRLKRK
jgi:hypothetical protein